jgi:hypothetical protein
MGSVSSPIKSNMPQTIKGMDPRYVRIGVNANTTRLS